MKPFNCPNCGGNERRGRYCAFCDSLILPEEPEQVSRFGKDSYDIPLGEYDGNNSNIVLEEDSFILRNFVVFELGNTHNSKIRYDQIRKLYYVRPKDKAVSWGYIIIRWTGNEHIPIPSKEQLDAAKSKRDETLLSFAAVDERVFIQIFWFLKSMAPSYIQWGIENPDDFADNASVIANSVNLDSYFEKHNPYRDTAVKELMKETGLRRKSAKALIDVAFDKRQEDLYALDPAAAIRDLNRLVQQAVKERWTWIVDV